jgi:hypothetical protein
LISESENVANPFGWLTLNGRLTFDEPCSTRSAARCRYGRTRWLSPNSCQR